MNAATSLASPRRGIAGFVHANLPGLVATALGALLAAALMTNWSFRLTSSPEHGFNGYYDALGESMLDGRFDVPPAAIGHEAFLLDGRTYGYFGPTPAVMRLPLNRLFPSLRGHWARISMVAACALTLFASYLALRYAAGSSATSPTLGASFVLGALVTTPMLFLVREAQVYHEASMWGVAFALPSYVAVLRYRSDGTLAALLGAIALALASFQARGSVGFGPYVAVGLLVLSMLLKAATTDGERRSRLLRHALVGGGIAALTLAAMLYKNFVVFGTVSSLPSLEHHVSIMHDTRRLIRTGGNFIQPRNLRTMLYNYFDPSQIAVTDTFPYIGPLRRADIRSFPETRLDWGAPFASFTAVNPLWLVLGVIGLVFVARPRLREAGWDRDGFAMVLVGAAVGAAPVLIVACIAQRYLHDFYPLYVIAAAVGIQGLVELYPRSSAARAVMPVIALLALYSCYANVAVSMALPMIDGTRVDFLGRVVEAGPHR